MTESPFIADTSLQYVWDSTSLGLLKTCPRKYYYTLIEGWVKKEKSVHLDFGGFYASALENYHKKIFAGLSHEDALDDTISQTLIASANFSPDNETYKTRENLIRSIIWYLEEFGPNDPATTVIIDGRPAVELTFKFDTDIPALNGMNFVLSGHLDRLVEFCGSTYVMDQKTTKMSLGAHYFKMYSPDNQMSLYSLASRIVFNTPVSGVIIDAAQILVGSTRFARGFALRSEAELDEWLADTEVWLDRAKNYAEEEKWPMNDTACGNYGGCAFRDVCSKSPQVRHVYLASEFEKKHWNPLEIR
jgi:hypothetical protein